MQDQITDGIRSFRLAPAFIAEHWDELGQYVKQLPSIPNGKERNETQLNIILAGLLSGFSYLWMTVDADSKILLVLLCSKIPFGCDGSRVLYIEGIKALGEVSSEIFKQLNVQMRDFARESHCVAVVGDTEFGNVVKLAKELGWTTAPVTRLYTEV